MNEENSMNREEHLQWCKQRAMAYVEAGDFSGAVTSMLSDLRSHPETEASGRGACAQLGMMELMRGPTRESITRFIWGFS